MPSLLSRSRCVPLRLALAVLAATLGAGVAVAPAAVAADAGHLAGLVEDHRGQSLVGAEVSLADPASGLVVRAVTTDSQGRYAVSIHTGRYDLTVTGASGSERIEAPVRDVAVGGDSRLNVVVAPRPSYLPEPDSDLRTASADSTPGTTFSAAALPAGYVTYTGTIRDFDGTPMDGQLGLNWLDGYWQGGTEVAADGSFHVTLPAGHYDLTFERRWVEIHDEPRPRDDWDTLHLRFTGVDISADRHDVITLPGVAFPVTVRDADGAPVAGAWVTGATGAYPNGQIDAPGPGTALWGSRGSVRRTGADGRAIIKIAPGYPLTNVWVEPPAGRGVSTAFSVPAGATALQAQLERALTLQGRITNHDGRPTTANVGFMPDRPGSQASGLTLNDDGTYIVSVLPGQYRFTFDTIDYTATPSDDGSHWEIRSEPITVSADRTLDLTLPREGNVRVRALGPDGQPASNSLFHDAVVTSPQGALTLAPGITATAISASYTAGGDDQLSDSIFVPSILTTQIIFDDMVSEEGAKLAIHVAPGDNVVVVFAGPASAVPPPSPEMGNDPPGSTPDPPAQPDPPAATATAARPAGYWTLASDGKVHNFGDAPGLGDTNTGAVDLEPTPTGKGYWTLNNNGTVAAFGDATKLGDVELPKLAGGEQPTSLSATPSGKGYWVFTNRGRAIAFGDAQHLGDMAQVKLNGPVLGSVATPSGKGYYMVASDGGIFAFGDAAFAGSMGGKKLNAPVQSLVPDADGTGYWLVASDGGIFAFAAPFRGSMGETKLNKPVVGMVRYGDGYLMVGADGGIFNFSTSPFAGSLGDKPPASPVVAVAALPGL